MKRVFLDTNILMDAAEYRRFSPEALTILDLCSAGIIHVCASTMSFATMSYLLRHYTKEHFHETIKHITSIVEVISVDVRHFESAINYGPVGDFEDLLQYQSAVAAGCEAIVTNDKKDFLEFCQIPCLSSPAFLQCIEES